MKNYSQKDERWANLTIGETDLTMKDYGCFVVSISILDGRTPDEVLGILNRNKAFNARGMLLSDVAAKVLGLSYKGKSKTIPDFSCIAETDHYKEHGVPQHFFVWLANGKIIDPLDGQEKDGFYYNVVNYRLFKKKKHKLEIEEKPHEEINIPIKLEKRGENNMNWKKVISSGFKAFLAAVIAEIIAILSLGIELYAPGDPIALVITKTFAIPIVAGVVKAIDNARKHLK